MCKKQNTAVKTCLLLARQTFSDLVGERASSLIINSEQVIEPFLVLNICFTFFLSVVDCTFYKSTIKSNCTLLSPYASEAVVRRCSVKKAFLEISQNSQKNTCARCLFLKRDSVTGVFL